MPSVACAGSGRPPQGDFAGAFHTTILSAPLTGKRRNGVDHDDVDGVSVAIEFLPDGKALILQRNRGLMAIAGFATGQNVDATGMPDMLVKDAAGAHDIELHPRYAESGWIYVSYSEGLYHFAARMAFVDGHLFLALGDREHPPMAQDNSNHAGTIVRLHDDGRVPADNPFAGAGVEEGMTPPRAEIWRFGHRDPQGP